MGVLVDALDAYGPWAVIGGIIVFGLFKPKNGIIVTAIHVFAQDRQDRRRHKEKMAHLEQSMSRRHKGTEDDR